MKSDLASYSSIMLSLFLVVPGIVITYVRSLFINSRSSGGSEVIIRYFAISAAYQAFAYPMFAWLTGHDADITKSFWWVLVFIFPVAVGLLLGLEIHYEWLRRRLRRLGVNPVHAIPSAWDWRFANTNDVFVFVTLKNETKFAGLLSSGSFVSSDVSERDIYIDRLYSWDNEQEWAPLDRSLLICGGEISTIEFHRAPTQRRQNEKAESA